MQPSTEQTLCATCTSSPSTPCPCHARPHSCSLAPLHRTFLLQPYTNKAAHLQAMTRPRGSCGKFLRCGVCLGQVIDSCWRMPALLPACMQCVCSVLCILALPDNPPCREILACAGAGAGAVARRSGSGRRWRQRLQDERLGREPLLQRNHTQQQPRRGQQQTRQQQQLQPQQQCSGEQQRLPQPEQWAAPANEQQPGQQIEHAQLDGVATG